MGTTCHSQPESQPPFTGPGQGRGFWVPEELVDLGPQLKPHAIYLYLCICRCPTLECYPTLEDLADKLRLTPTRVDSLLHRLETFGMLNSHDTDRVRRTDRPSADE